MTHMKPHKTFTQLFFEFNELDYQTAIRNIEPCFVTVNDESMFAGFKDL